METPTLISETGIHIHPNYNLEGTCIKSVESRTESAMNPSAEDSLLEGSIAGAIAPAQRKPVAASNEFTEARDELANAREQRLVS